MPKQKSRICAGLNKNGLKCTRKVTKGTSNYCWQHDINTKKSNKYIVMYRHAMALSNDDVVKKLRSIEKRVRTDKTLPLKARKEAIKLFNKVPYYDVAKKNIVATMICKIVELLKIHF